MKTTIAIFILAAVTASAQELVPSATPQTSGTPTVAKAGAVAEREVVTRLQIFLDQQNFGTGKIDGRWGEFTGKGLVKYAESHGLKVTPNIYNELPLDSVYPIYTIYTIQEGDLQWVGPTANKPAAQSKLKKLLYGSLLEFVCERYHCGADLLMKINPGADLEKLKPGDDVRVPNVAPFKIEEINSIARLPEVPEFRNRSVFINRKDHMLTLVDGEKILAAFPITPGSDHTPTPPGNWTIVGITSLPNFRWDDGVLNHGVRTEKFYMLPPGPNNPVGVAWTALSKPGIGIHGTNNPDTIGRAASHGCMRLANWDAVRFAYMVTKGVKVTIQ